MRSTESLETDRWTHALLIFCSVYVPITGSLAVWLARLPAVGNIYCTFYLTWKILKKCNPESNANRQCSLSFWQLTLSADKEASAKNIPWLVSQHSWLTGQHVGKQSVGVQSLPLGLLSYLFPFRNTRFGQQTWTVLVDSLPVAKTETCTTSSRS